MIEKESLKDTNIENSNTYPQNAFQGIVEVINILTLAFRLENAFKENLIDEQAFTKSILIDSKKGMGINESTFDRQKLEIQFRNLVLSNIGTLTIAIDTALDATFKSKNPDGTDSINCLRNVFYMLRCAFAHDPIHPKWDIKEKYQKTYKVIILKEIMQKISNNRVSAEISFEFNFKALSERYKKTVLFEDFYGIDGLINLSLYAVNLTESI